LGTFLSFLGISEESKRKILWDNCANADFALKRGERLVFFSLSAAE
jgi:hypothetical protein